MLPFALGLFGLALQQIILSGLYKSAVACSLGECRHSVLTSLLHDMSKGC